MSLPECSYNAPSCGSCGDDLRYEDASFYCEECQLDYGDGNDGTEAAFVDTHAAKCAKPCENYWHGEGKLRAGYGFECAPCALPVGHTSACWTPCASIRLKEES